MNSLTLQAPQVQRSCLLFPPRSRVLQVYPPIRVARRPPMSSLQVMLKRRRRQHSLHDMGAKNIWDVLIVG